MKTNHSIKKSGILLLLTIGSIAPLSVLGDGPGICLRNNPAWYQWGGHLNCTPSCTEYKRTTGSSCVPDLTEYCVDLSTSSMQYWRPGQCLTDETGQLYCDYTGSAWSELFTTTVPTCADTTNTGGGGVSN